jgi:uncharacterized protein YaiL (DUF2058 family)
MMCTHTTTTAENCNYTQTRTEARMSALQAEVGAARVLATTTQTEAAAIKLEKSQLARTTQLQAQQAAEAKAQVHQLQLLFVEHTKLGVAKLATLL